MTSSSAVLNVGAAFGAAYEFGSFSPGTLGGLSLNFGVLLCGGTFSALDLAPKAFLALENLGEKPSRTVCAFLYVLRGGLSACGRGRGCELEAAWGGVEKSTGVWDRAKILAGLEDVTIIGTSTDILR